MRRVFVASTIIAGFVAVAAPAAAQAVAGDWSGAYGGVTLGQVSGDWAHLDAVGTVLNDGDYDSSAFYGRFAGYNFQNGNIVYGGELGLSDANDFCFSDYPAECTKGFVDVKARVGYATGPA